MRYLVKAEAIVPFLISVVLLRILPIELAWWIWFLLFFAPDISMLGYLVNNKVGAIAYNIFHHQLIAVVIWAIGMFLQEPLLQLAGLLLLGHSSFDRLMGYGLKSFEGFKFTHLGPIGNKFN